ncbi:hypothetical protein D3C78_1738750 [compost metagenome]
MILRLAFGRRDLPGGNHQHAEAVLVEGIDTGHQLLAAARIEGNDLVAFLHMGGDGEHFLDRPFAYQQVIAQGILHHH